MASNPRDTSVDDLRRLVRQRDEAAAAAASGGPSELGKVINKALNRSAAERARETISSRLERKFGLGDRPEKRRILYSKLEALHAKYPDLVHEIISTAVMESVGKRWPDRYFCVAVNKKIAEAGLTIGTAADAKW